MTMMAFEQMTPGVTRYWGSANEGGSRWGQQLPMLFAHFTFNLCIAFECIAVLPPSVMVFLAPTGALVVMMHYYRDPTLSNFEHLC